MACQVAPGPSSGLGMSTTPVHGTLSSTEPSGLEPSLSAVAPDSGITPTSSALVTAAVVHAVAAQLLEDAAGGGIIAVPGRVTEAAAPTLSPAETESAEPESAEAEPVDAEPEDDEADIDAGGEQGAECGGPECECAPLPCGDECGGHIAVAAETTPTAADGKKVRKPNPHHKKGKPPVQYDMLEVANAKAPEVAALIADVEAMAMAVFGEQRFITQVGHSAWRLHVVVEREARTLLGFVLFEHRRKKNCVSVAKVAVSDVLRGYGVGRKLMKIPKHYAKEVGAEVINLWAYFAAVGFYKHLGFRACKAVVEPAEGAGEGGADAAAAEVSSCWMRDDVAQYMELVVATPDKRKRGGKKKKK